MKNRIVAAVFFVALPVMADLPPITTTALNETGGYVPSVTVGPDGAIWFVDADNNVIARVAASAGATPTKYAVPTPNAGLSSITTGPDGNLWFLESAKIGKITTSGAITEYPLTGVSSPGGLTAGPDGNLWFVGFGTSGFPPKTVIAKVSTSGASAGTVNLPGNPNNVKLAPGPGNAMWFHDLGDNTVGAINGSSVQSFSFKTAETAGGFRAAGNMAQGPDGNMWVGHSAAVARVTPSGTITEYQVPGAGFISGVALGADGNIWFTDHANGKIGRLIVSSATDQGTATMDQGSAGLASPSALFPATSVRSSARVIPLDQCTQLATAFVEEADPTPPPHIALLQADTPKCTDIEATSIEGKVSRERKGYFWFESLIKNNGPNDATVTVNISINGAVPLRGFLGSAACEVFSKSLQCTHTIPAKEYDHLQVGVIQVGATATVISVNEQATSNLPDPVPTNNTAALLFDSSTYTGLGILPGLSDPAPPLSQRGAH